MPEGAREPSLVERLIASYDPGFLRTMRVTPRQAVDPEAMAEALAGLRGAARDLADTLLIGVGAGEPVPPRLLPRIERDGDALWRIGMLLPRMAPSPGATIDPRYYAAACRINPALSGVRPLPEVREGIDASAHMPPSDALWDAVIIAAALEESPATLTRDGRLRKDVERRLFEGLGGEPERWSLALSLARATGLVRDAAGRLYGRPESYPRRLALSDPATLLEGEAGVAAASLLRVVESSWLDLDRLIAALGARCPEVLSSDPGGPFEAREGRWIRQAADVLHRAGVLDASRGPNGVVALRLATARPARPQGFFLTPDLEILVAPGELPGNEYGRLCRVAPYVDGDVVHRHRLTRDGVAAELAAGYDDLIDWLRTRSRTGLPRTVSTMVEQWMAQAIRVTMYTGVTVLEVDGVFTVHTEAIPASARLIYYDEPPAARFVVREGVIEVPFREDALTVRAVVSQLGPPLPPGPTAHRWALAPADLPDPDHLLDQLRRFHDGALPGELEAAVHAAGGRTTCWLEEAVVLHVPGPAVEGLQRDRVAGPLLGREIASGQCVVARADLPVLQARLADLGFALGPRPDPTLEE